MKERREFLGGLNEMVTLQASAALTDGAGGRTLSWSDMATIWAALEPKKSEIITEAGRARGRTHYQVTARYRDDIDCEMRLLWRDQILKITGVLDPDGRRERLVIDCETDI